MGAEKESLRWSAGGFPPLSFRALAGLGWGWGRLRCAGRIAQEPRCASPRLHREASRPILENDLRFLENGVSAKDNDAGAIALQGNTEGRRRNYEGTALQRNAEVGKGQPSGHVAADGVKRFVARLGSKSKPQGKARGQHRDVRPRIEEPNRLYPEGAHLQHNGNLGAQHSGGTAPTDAGVGAPMAPRPDQTRITPGRGTL